jgi:putative ABC transport system substrate-binding protein
MGQRMQFAQLKRREFITLLGGTATMGPLAVRAEQRARLPIIGFLGPGTPLAWGQWVAAFVQRLHEHGWIEGRTVAIEYRWAEGRSERYAEIASEFVRLNVDVIVTAGTPPVLAAKNATAVIPIIFASSGDPVRTGLVASLARPGSNVTGLSIQQADLVGKRLEILREVVPDLRRLAVLANVTNPIVVIELAEVEATARKKGLEFVRLEIRRAQDIAPAIEAHKGRADALYIVSDAVTNDNRVRISTLALTARLPTVYIDRSYPEAGGFISYGPNRPDLYRRAADFVDKILRGAKPADIPVEQPIKFELVVNLTTAKALGLTIPESFLLRADEVIE